MAVEQLEGHGLQRFRRGRDLGEHVDAVGVLVDHPLQPAHLSLDAPQSALHRVLLVRIARHPPSSEYPTPLGYHVQPEAPRSALTRDPFAGGVLWLMARTDSVW